MKITLPSVIDKNDRFIFLVEGEAISHSDPMGSIWMRHLRFDRISSPVHRFLYPSFIFEELERHRRVVISGKVHYI